MPEPGLPGFVDPPTPPGFASSSLELGAMPWPDTPDFFPVVFFFAVELFFDVPPAVLSDVFLEVVCCELVEVVAVSVLVVHDAINATPSNATTAVRSDFFIGM